MEFKNARIHTMTFSINYLKIVFLTNNRLYTTTYDITDCLPSTLKALTRVFRVDDFGKVLGCHSYCQIGIENGYVTEISNILDSSNNVYLGNIVVKAENFFQEEEENEKD